VKLVGNEIGDGLLGIDHTRSLPAMVTVARICCRPTVSPDTRTNTMVSETEQPTAAGAATISSAENRNKARHETRFEDDLRSIKI
jgi:hypothetical protein